MLNLYPTIECLLDFSQDNQNMTMEKLNNRKSKIKT